MMYLAQSYDHRIIDGREAVLSLVAIRKKPSKTQHACCSICKLLRAQASCSWTDDTIRPRHTDTRKDLTVNNSMSPLSAADQAATLPPSVRLNSVLTRLCVDCVLKPEKASLAYYGGTCLNVGCIPSKAFAIF